MASDWSNLNGKGRKGSKKKEKEKKKEVGIRLWPRVSLRLGQTRPIFKKNSVIAKELPEYFQNF